MKKVYGVSFIYIVKNLIMFLIFSALASIFIWFLSGEFFNYHLSKPMIIIIALIFYLLYIILVFKDGLIKIEIEDNLLKYTKNKKTKTFKIDECYFKASSINASQLSLDIETLDGQKESLDLDLLGFFKYNQIISDLNIDGKIKAHKINIKTKGE